MNFVPMTLKMNRQSWLIFGLILILTVYQVVRLIVFANVYGGIEEDSGWYSSIARSLAERGTYTTMTSTIVDPTAPAGINIHEHFDIQDQEGRIWFFTVNWVGPGSIVPNAMILKLFGVNFWSLKAGALLFYSLFLLLASFLIYSVGGIIPVVLFHLFFVFYPHLVVYLGYEPFAEMPTMVYILLAYLLFVKAIQAKQHQVAWFFLCGLCGGLTLVTKLTGLLPLSSLFVLWFLEFRRGNATLKQLAVLGCGLVSLPLLWEIIQFLTIVQLTNFETYQLHAAERISFFEDESHTGGESFVTTNFGEFTLAKLLIFSQVSHPHPILGVVMFGLIIASGPVLVYLRSKELIANRIILLFWFGWLTHSLWFLGISKTAWIRRDWFALVLGIALFCWLVGYFIQRARRKPAWHNLTAAILLVLLTLINFSGQRQAMGWFIPDSLVETWRLNFLANDTLAGKYEQRMPWIIIPRAQQEEVIEYLRQLPAAGKIFYAGNLKVAELPVIVGRIFYPIQRRPFMPHGDEDVVVIGSRAFSPWRRPQALIEPIKQEIKSQCPQLLLENDYYIICSVTD